MAGNEKMQDNFLSRKWRDRYEQQTLGVKKKLDDLYNQDPRNYQLKVVKRKKINPQKGDVFLLSPVKGIYFYGLVVNNEICSINGNDLLVILIFKSMTTELNDKNFKIDLDNLLIRPCMVGKEYWRKGYFFNIGHISIQSKIDYGFYDVIDDKFYDEYENELNYIPQLIGMFGVSTITGIAYNVWQELIIDERLIHVNDEIC